LLGAGAIHYIMAKADFTITADTSKAVEEINKLTKSIDKLVKATKPKWWQFWKWFRPVITNLNIDKIMSYDEK
jgi:hypothetical protein